MVPIFENKNEAKKTSFANHHHYYYCCASLAAVVIASVMLNPISATEGELSNINLRFVAENSSKYQKEHFLKPRKISYSEEVPLEL